VSLLKRVADVVETVLLGKPMPDELPVSPPVVAASESEYDRMMRDPARRARFEAWLEREGLS
jgi:hypothetical protein